MLQNCLHFNHFKRSKDCKHWCFTVMKCAPNLNLELNQNSPKSSRDSVRQFQTPGQTDGIIQSKYCRNRLAQQLPLPELLFTVDMKHKRRQEDGCWYCSLDLTVQHQNTGQKSACSQDFKKGLQSFSHDCMAVCSCDFSSESQGNKRRGECAVLCCSLYSCYFLAHWGVYGILCEW